MAFALNYTVITSIKLGVSLFDDTRPDFFRILAPSKHKLSLIVYRQLIINYYVNLLQEFIKTDHVCSFLVAPYLTLAHTHWLLYPTLSKYTHWTDQITVSYASLLHIVCIDFSLHQSLTSTRSSPFVNNWTQAAKCWLIRQKLLINVFLFRFNSVDHIIELVDLLIRWDERLLFELFEHLLFSLLMQLLFQLSFLLLLYLHLLAALLMLGQNSLIPNVILGLQIINFFCDQLVFRHEISDRKVDGLDVYPVLHQTLLYFFCLADNFHHFRFSLSKHSEFDEHSPKEQKLLLLFADVYPLLVLSSQYTVSSTFLLCGLLLLCFLL